MAKRTSGSKDLGAIRTCKGLIFQKASAFLGPSHHAGSAQAQTKVGIPSVGFTDGEQLAPQSSHVTQTEYHRPAELALDREVVMDPIRKLVASIVPQRTDQRQVRTKIEVLGRGTSRRWNDVGEWLPLRFSCSPGSERLLEQRRRRRPPVLAKRYSS